MSEKKIGIFSFFAGAGFLDLGFEKTDKYKTLLVNEIHPPFMDIYQYSREVMNIPVPDYGYSVSDIETFLEAEKLRELKKWVQEARKKYSLVGFIGGPPCPDFSVAGKNKGKEGENGRLSGTYTKLICQIQPDFFLFENVKGLYRTRKHREFFEDLKNEFKVAGYSLTEKLINAIEFGAPQDRERIILIGVHQRVIEQKQLNTQERILTDFDWENQTKYTLQEITDSAWPAQTEFNANVVTEQPAGIIKELTVEYWFRKNKVNTHVNCDRFFTPRGGLNRFLEIREGDDKKKSFKRLHRWRYSPTAAYGNNEVHLHPYQPRRISVAEALAIQSLPREYILPEYITLSNAFKAIGNGVPYLAARGLAMTIYNYLKP